MKDMLEYNKGNQDDKIAIMNDVIRIIEEIASGWESQFEQSVGPESLLGAELGFKSVDFIRLIAAIQQHYSQAYIPFQDLFISDDGEILLDIQVSYLVDFLHNHLNGHESSE
jgi:acyl carrier protein